MLSSRELMQLENQRFYMSNSMPPSRQGNSKLQSSDLPLSNIPQSTNLVQGIGGHISVTNPSTVQSTTQNSSSSVYNGFYSSSTFNSVNNFEASLQWLTENRMPNNTLLSDKNLNCSSTPSHSCCVNRLGVGGVDNIGMCSPLSGDSFRSNRDTGNYQTKPPALSVNVIDSVQNWFNLPTLPNQQYNGKFNDQNVNCSQINLPMIEQNDLKQNDICLQITDTYFEPSLNVTNNKSLTNNNISQLNSAKITDMDDLPSIKNYNNSYQTNIITRESWKQPLQTAASYISSPTLFNTLSDSPEHYLYSLPPPTSSSGPYCMIPDNTGNINSNKLSQNNCSGLQQATTTISSRLLPCSDQNISNQMKISGHVNHQINQNLQHDSRNEKALQLHNRISDNLKLNHVSVSNTTQSNTCTMVTSKNTNNCENGRKYNEEVSHYSSVYLTENNNNGDSELLKQKLIDISKESSNSVIEIADESTSDSDESNIIVEESDDTEEIDSVISIDEIKKTYMEEEPVELRCLVCNLKSSPETPATQFIHMNDSFPLTSASKTPVASKLIQILPNDLQHFMKLHNSFMCRRCLNLIETVEVLEVKLTSVKQTLSENFSKTVQYFLPATPIVEIENGTAKIIGKEIIPSLEKSNGDIGSSFTESANASRISQEDHLVTEEMKESESEDEDVDEDTENEEEKEKGVDDGERKESEVDENNSKEESLESGENSGKENEENSISNKRKPCKICGKVLSSLKNYKNHMQLHTKCFSFYCEYCGKGFNFKKSLDTHIRQHTDDNRYQCEKCGKTYSQKHRLDGHLRRHLGEFKSNCKECGKGFVEKAELEKHMKSHTKERLCVCEICGVKFSKPSNLTAHLQLCKKEEVKCNLCDEVFYSKTHLKKHKVTSHGAAPSSECNICGKAFVNVKALKPHMRTHSEDKPFECKLCGKRYKSVSNLNHHAKIHDINKLFKCTVCGEEFSRKKFLDDHMNIHLGERVYKCSECNKDFFEQRYLQYHMRIHSDTVKMQTCNVCGKKFLNGLKVHMRTHTGLKPYVCNICGKAFTVNSVLRRHMQTKHRNVYES